MKVINSLTSINELQENAEKYFIQENYIQAANIYERIIEIEPETKFYYWNLGLMLLLQGQEVEAQTSWFMAMLDGEAEQLEEWNKELVDVLEQEAQRYEKLQKYMLAWKIRQQIREIVPQNINNLLLLLKLAIHHLKNYTGDELSELGVIQVLKTEPQVEVDFHLLMELLRIILKSAPLHLSSIEFLEACLPYCTSSIEDKDVLLGIILDPAIEIAYTYNKSAIAAKICELYLTVDDNNREVLGHLAGFYQNFGAFDKGIETAKKLYALQDNLPDKIYGNRQIIRGLMTSGGLWEEAEKLSIHQNYLLELLVQDNPNNLEPAQILRLFNANYFASYFADNPRMIRNIQNQIGKICQTNNQIHYSEHIEKFSQGILNRKKPYQTSKKIKVGYISHCLKSHSVGWLARWLFKHHDREKFQVNAYFMNNNSGHDGLHQWYINIADQAFHSNNIFTLANQIFQDEIDILIDLDSITIDTTCEVLALKPAPIQATWLGFDASGIPTVDYFIADNYVLPESSQEYYSEKIWRLPHSYIAVDGFEVSVPTLHRSDLDIPSDAVVYLCAQRGFKRHPDIAKLQLKIIKQVENSYFLIKGVADEDSNKAFFDQLAEEEDIDISRLRFLPEVPAEAAHRANLSIADVVLDTYPYNGATTTMETLWMCIPMVTKVGEQFAARNSYTMMINAGITEGIAWSDEEYIEWGVRLGKDEELRRQISWQLRQSRKTAPLWNGKQFTSEMEKAYEQMWQIYVEG